MQPGRRVASSAAFRVAAGGYCNISISITISVSLLSERSAVRQQPPKRLAGGALRTFSSGLYHHDGRLLRSRSGGAAQGAAA
jgi:hypothetical protein